MDVNGVLNAAFDPGSGTLKINVANVVDQPPTRVRDAAGVWSAVQTAAGELRAVVAG